METIRCNKCNSEMDLTRKYSKRLKKNALLSCRSCDQRIEVGKNFYSETIFTLYGQANPGSNHYFKNVLGRVEEYEYQIQLQSKIGAIGFDEVSKLYSELHTEIKKEIADTKIPWWKFWVKVPDELLRRIVAIV